MDKANGSKANKVLTLHLENLPCGRLRQARDTSRRKPIGVYHGQEGPSDDDGRRERGNQYPADGAAAGAAGAGGREGYSGRSQQVPCGEGVHGRADHRRAVWTEGNGARCNPWRSGRERGKPGRRVSQGQQEGQRFQCL